MAAHILYWGLGFYGVLILAVNTVAFYKLGPEPWVVFQTAGGATILALAVMAITERITARWVWGVVAMLLVTDIGWRALS